LVDRHGKKQPKPRKPASDTQGVLLDFLKQQIQDRENLRDDIDKSIRILRDAERELRRNIPGEGSPPEEDAGIDLPYRIQASAEPPRTPPPPPPAEPAPPPPASDEPAFGFIRPGTPGEIPSARWEPEPLPRGREPLAEPFELSRRPTRGRGTIESPYRRQTDEILQEDQMLLLGREEVPAARRRGTQAKASPPPHAATSVEEEFIPSDGLNFKERSGWAPAGETEPPRAEAPAAPRASRPAPAPEPGAPALQRLMAYIRSGNAVRCVDPWNQICTAFVIRPDGSAIFATDVFLNYIRKALRELRRAHEGSANGGAPDAPSPELSRKLEPFLSFLGSLTGTLKNQETIGLRSVPGLTVAGRNKLPASFEFERSTEGVMNPQVLELLHAILQRPAREFFAPDGACSDIGDYLNQYKTFTRANTEERRAAAMLAQIGLEAGAPGPREAAGEPLSDAPHPFLEETEELQDLSTFDFSPDDKKSILAQKESAFSQTQFRRLTKDDAGKEKEETSFIELDEEDLSEERSAPSGEEKKTKPPAGDDDSMDDFLKDMGTEWK